MNDLKSCSYPLLGCEDLWNFFSILSCISYTLPVHFQVPLIRIKSLNQYRIPGPIATVFVECPPAEPGEICPPHGHLKMDLNFDGNARRNMLVPIWVTLVVPIWVTLLC